MNISDAPVLAICVKTLMRDGCIQSLVASIEKFCHIPYRLYIADEMPISISKLQLYERLRAEGHSVHIYDTSVQVHVTTARNEMLEKLQGERYILRLDDDFVFFEGTRVDYLINLLEARAELGAVTGVEIQGFAGKRVLPNQLSPGQGFVQLDSVNKIMVRRLIPVESWHWSIQDGIRFAYADFTRNFLLIRRKVAEQVKWNPALIIDGEHIDFMLRVKEAGWALAFTPDSVHYHLDPPKAKVSKLYLRTRNSRPGHQAMKKEFQRQWGILEIMAVSHYPEKDPVVWLARMKRAAKNLLQRVKK